MAFDKDKTLGYMRIGIYELMHNGTMKNFCDVHTFGGADGNLLQNTRYSGPDRSMSESLKGRTEKDVTRWREDTVADHDIGDGGDALLYYATPVDTHYCWLFGPLKYDGRGYGSLVLDFIRWEAPKARVVKDKAHGAVALFTFPNIGKVQPCGVYETDFARSDIGSLIFRGNAMGKELLKDARRSMRAVTPRKEVKAFRWRVEAGKSRQSQQDYMTARG